MWRTPCGASQKTSSALGMTMSRPSRMRSLKLGVAAIALALGPATIALDADTVVVDVRTPAKYATGLPVVP
jgi:hypothetical protein